MNTTATSRRWGVALSGAAVVAAVIAGCNADAKEAPPQQVLPPQAPITSINPTGPNSFTPTVLAPGPQTALPGNVVTGS